MAGYFETNSIFEMPLLSHLESGAVETVLLRTPSSAGSRASLFTVCSQESAGNSGREKRNRQEQDEATSNFLGNGDNCLIDICLKTDHFTHAGNNNKWCQLRRALTNGPGTTSSDLQIELIQSLQDPHEVDCITIFIFYMRTLRHSRFKKLALNLSGLSGGAMI